MTHHKDTKTPRKRTDRNAAPPPFVPLWLRKHPMEKILSCLLTFVILNLSGVQVHSSPPEKPNVIFFLADDLGYMDIGAFNPKTFYETPNIDGIAKKGMRFTDGYAACGVCSPTRSSIMTGKYPPRTGITDHSGGKRAGKLLPAPHTVDMALEEYTIAEAMRDAGYSTFFAGKWHLGSKQFSPNGQGFDPDLISLKGGYFPAGSKDPDPAVDPKNSDLIADSAVVFINAHKDKPFFAYLPFNAVHIPMGARPDLVEKYKNKQASAPKDEWGQEGENKVRLVQNNPVYAAMLEQMDSAVGRVLEAVKQNGLSDRTAIIFMSDNGGLSTAEGHVTSNIPLRAGKGWLYEGGVREPVIIDVPGMTKPGSTCDTPVTSTDFYPTILQLAGLPLNPKQHSDGTSLVPLLEGKPLERGPIFWHYPHYSNQGGAPAGAIRDGDWKLVEWFEDGRLELFNLRDDLGEKNNLATANPNKTKELHNKLIAWRKDVQAVMPLPNPDYDPAHPVTKPKKQPPGE